LAATAKQLRYKEAALAAQEQASAEEEGKTQAMMFALLQDQHKLQLMAMAVANKATMNAMMGRMNAILGGGSSRTSTRNKDKMQPPTPTGGDQKAKKDKRKKKLCPHCNMFVFHKPNRCYELDADKDKQWVGWILVKEAST
jgi:hypothetical protein